MSGLSGADPMRLGAVIRMDDRGLAHLTQEFVRHIRPERVLVVDMHDPMFPMRTIRPTVGTQWFYASFNRNEGTLSGLAEEFLDGLSHVYTAETGYDPMFFELARTHGVASICHVMPEFDRFTNGPADRKPTAIWVPTRWRKDKVAGSKVVAVPVPVAPRPRKRTEAKTFVHVIGCRARPDRAGTLAVYEAIRRTPDVRWILFAQDERGGQPSTLRGCPNVEIRYGSLDDRWALYDEADVLVAPRRFGGLSLPVLEATACGVPIIMGSQDPMGGYGSVFVEQRQVDTFEAAGGVIGLLDVDPGRLAEAVMSLADGVLDVRKESVLGLRAAEIDGWPAMVGKYRAEIEKVHL